MLSGSLGFYLQLDNEVVHGILFLYKCWLVLGSKQAPVITLTT